VEELRKAQAETADSAGLEELSAAKELAVVQDEVTCIRHIRLHGRHALPPTDYGSAP
jgi:hypothetical protein